MRFLQLTAVLGILLIGRAAGQSPTCRQSWMPTDAPAFCTWQQEQAFPEARTYHATALSGNNIYTLGGFRFDAGTGQVIYYNTVVRSTIGGDGRLSPWTTETAFTGPRSGAAATAVNGCLFVNGGSSSTQTSQTYFDDTHYARIGADGRLSNWSSVPSRLNTARSNHSLVAMTTPQGTFLHAVAGVTQIGSDTVHLDTIEVAKVEKDCALGRWSVANYHLKGGRSTPQALNIRNNLVVIGGWGDLDLVDVYDDVQVTMPRDDGSPGPWRTTNSRLTSGIYGHGTLLAEPAVPTNPSTLFSVGGQAGTGVYATWVSYAYVQPAGPLVDAIGTWRIAPSGRLPTGRAGVSVVSRGDRLYVLGGNDAAGQYYREVLSAQFDPGKP